LAVWLLLVFAQNAIMFGSMKSPLSNDLLERCEQLPPARVREVLDFAEFLATRTSGRRVAKRGQARRLLSAFVGGVSHGKLARNIDHDLYNGAVR
jgi:hypothetical protein